MFGSGHEDGGALVVGVAGGSGSGKTTLASRLMQAVGSDLCAVVSQDNYYHDLGHIDFQARTEVNFDHPESLDAQLMTSHVKALLEGGDVSVPQYDFSRHVRRSTERVIGPRPLIVVEGILVLVWHQLRDLMDLCVFVDAPSDVRLSRRLRRDVSERGRDPEGVLAQYHATVRPMYREFVGPSSAHADLLIDGQGDLDTSVAMVVDRLKSCSLQRTVAASEVSSGRLRAG